MLPLRDHAPMVDLRVGECPNSGRKAVVIVVEGIPTTASMPVVVASILSSLQSALGARLQERRPTAAH